MTKERNFIVQQGFSEPPADGCSARYGALQFQPRVVGGLFLLSALFQSPALFFFLSFLLWVGVIAPRRNLFEALYNHWIAPKKGETPIQPAPVPRRFAQGMAATFALFIASSLTMGYFALAYTLEVLMAFALAGLLFYGFCLGSFLYHFFTGRRDFALATLPWKSRGPSR